MPTPRYILFDRDGTLIVERHYLADPAGVELFPDTGDALRRLASLGFRFIIVTNQSGIARGYFDEATLAAIHQRMHELLAAEGITIDAVYHCPHHERDACTCRKPNPGMAASAAAEFGFVLREAIVVGDKCADVGLGQAIGATTILLRTGHGRDTEHSGECQADYTADNLSDAADWLERRESRR